MAIFVLLYDVVRTCLLSKCLFTKRPCLSGGGGLDSLLLHTLISLLTEAYYLITCLHVPCSLTREKLLNLINDQDLKHTVSMLEKEIVIFSGHLSQKCNYRLVLRGQR